MTEPHVDYTVLLGDHLGDKEVEQIRSDLEKRLGVSSVETTKFKRLKMNQLEVKSSAEDFRELWGGNLEYKPAHEAWYCDNVEIPSVYRGKVISVNIVRDIQATQ